MDINNHFSMERIFLLLLMQLNRHHDDDHNSHIQFQFRHDIIIFFSTLYTEPPVIVKTHQYVVRYLQFTE